VHLGGAPLIAILAPAGEAYSDTVENLVDLPAVDPGKSHRLNAHYRFAQYEYRQVNGSRSRPEDSGDGPHLVGTVNAVVAPRSYVIGGKHRTRINQQT
jgi:hypothetical protein